MAKTTNVEQIEPRTNGFTKAYGTAHDSEDDVSNYDHDDYDDEAGDDDDPLKENGCCAAIITFFSYVFVFLTLPLSIWGCVKVIVKEDSSSSSSSSS